MPISDGERCIEKMFDRIGRSLKPIHKVVPSRIDDLEASGLSFVNPRPARSSKINQILA